MKFRCLLLLLPSLAGTALCQDAGNAVAPQALKPTLPASGDALSQAGLAANPIVSRNEIRGATINVSPDDLRLLEAARSVDNSQGFSVRDKGRSPKTGAIKQGKRIFLRK